VVTVRQNEVEKAPNQTGGNDSELLAAGVVPQVKGKFSAKLVSRIISAGILQDYRQSVFTNW